MVVGDSLVFGYGVDAEEAWPQRLSRSTGKTVINLGLIGASPQQSRKVLETYGLPRKPKLVVFGFFARNDFWDANMYSAWENSGIGGNYLTWRGFGSPTAEQYADPFKRVFFQLRKRSYVLGLVKYGRDALSGRRGGAPAEVQLASGESVFLHLDDYAYKTQLSAEETAQD